MTFRGEAARVGELIPWAVGAGVDDSPNQSPILNRLSNFQRTTESSPSEESEFESRMTVSMKILDPEMDEEADGWVNLGGETLGTSILMVTRGARLKEVPACEL